MQPTNPLQPRGSFVKPQNLSKAIAQAEAAPPTPTPPESAPPVVNEATPVEKTSEEKVADAQAERRAQLAAYKTELEAEIGVEITEEDIKRYLFKGALSKVIEIVPGLMKGSFQTLSIGDLQKIDVRMAKIRDEAEHTPRGLENEEAVIALSYAWTHAEDRPLGDDATSREKKIRLMGSLFIERASSARVKFDTLLKIVMGERGLLKK